MDRNCDGRLHDNAAHFCHTPSLDISIERAHLHIADSSWGTAHFSTRNDLKVWSTAMTSGVLAHYIARRCVRWSNAAGGTNSLNTLFGQIAYSLTKPRLIPLSAS
ncbi:hypothetical protein [Paraburkholderia solitsugae]|uniref:hypothetical protein n=1 Tax=Paraburkholderia solitsugae TaxID=2675748 RepID=UPI00155336E7|nr:hypothetical protein [Paraburkholderia solitsugae]